MEPTSPTGQPSRQPSARPSSSPTPKLLIAISFTVQQKIYFSSSTAGWQSGLTRAVASLYPSPSKVNVTILSMQSFSLQHETEAQVHLRRSLTGGLTVTYKVVLRADSVDNSDSTGASAQIIAQNIITSAISSGAFTTALSGAGGLTGASVPAGTPAIIVTLAAVILHSPAPTLEPSRATAMPTPTAPNATPDPLDINTGNNKWIALSLGGFLIIFVFLFSVVCHRMQHRKSKKKMEERGLLVDLERKSVHEQQARKAARISSLKVARSSARQSASASASAGPRGASQEAADLEAWTHSTRHENPLHAAKHGRKDEGKEEQKEGDEEKGGRGGKEKGEPHSYGARMAQLGVKPTATRPALHALPQGASVSSRVEGEWVQKWSKSKQATYYKNTVTHEVAWRPPPGDAAAAEVPVGKKPSSMKQEREQERERDRERAAEKEREKKAAYTSRKEGHHDRTNPAFAHDLGDYHKPDRHHHRKTRDEPHSPSPSSKHSHSPALEPILSRGDKKKEGTKHRVKISLDEPSDEPPPDEPEEPPPEDEVVWVEKWHVDKQRAYYKERETGVVTWVRPEGEGITIVPYAKSKKK